MGAFGPDARCSLCGRTIEGGRPPTAEESWSAGKGNGGVGRPKIKAVGLPLLD